jgi:hypothetical protein
MASEALNWALANGMTQAEFDRNIFNAVLDAQKNNTSNALLRIEMDRLGISPEDVARATGVATQGVQTQYAAAAAAANELAARTARDPTASQALIDARNLAATTATSKLPASQQTAITTGTQNLVATQNAAALALQQRNEAARLAALTAGTTTGGLLGPTGNMSITGTTPFANATQGFAQNFANYQSIPIGAQYNPNVVGGAGSPYAQVMGQMRPVGNPYANVVAGQAMGGYNPALYDQIAAANVARTAAANAGVTLADYYGGGGDGGDGGGGGGGGTGAGAGTGNAMAKGGYVHGGLMFGANPPGPDDGAVNLDIGEYVIKKSSVNKYGRGLLDMINEGKVPAKKMKSLLG